MLLWPFAFLGLHYFQIRSGRSSFAGLCIIINISNITNLHGSCHRILMAAQLLVSALLYACCPAFIALSLRSLKSSLDHRTEKLACAFNLPSHRVSSTHFAPRNRSSNSDTKMVVINQCLIPTYVLSREDIAYPKRKSISWPRPIRCKLCPGSMPGQDSLFIDFIIHIKSQAPGSGIQYCSKILS